MGTYLAKRLLSEGQTVAILSAALLFTIFSSSAQAEPAGPRDTNRTVYSFSFSPIYQFDSNFDHAGSFSVQRYAFNFDTSKPITNALRAGISLGYEFETFDFSGTTAFAGADPWNDIHRFSAGLPVNYRMTDSNGNELGTDNFKTAPMMALSLTLQL